MRLLVDTHVIIWLLSGDGRLGRAARTLLDEGAEDVFVSVLALWEIALKRGIGRLPIGLEQAEAAISIARYERLPILPTHAHAFAALPAHPNHRDPFDRMLVAQARAEGLTLMTNDAKLTTYGVPTIGCA